MTKEYDNVWTDGTYKYSVLSRDGQNFKVVVLNSLSDTQAYDCTQIGSTHTITFATELWTTQKNPILEVQHAAGTWTTPHSQIPFFATNDPRGYTNGSNTTLTLRLNGNLPEVHFQWLGGPSTHLWDGNASFDHWSPPHIIVEHQYTVWRGYECF